MQCKTDPYIYSSQFELLSIDMAMQRDYIHFANIDCISCKKLKHISPNWRADKQSSITRSMNMLAYNMLAMALMSWRIVKRSPDYSLSIIPIVILILACCDGGRSVL